MLGKRVQEISIKGMNWDNATKIIKILVEEEFATMVTVEDELIIIDYVYAGDYDTKQADRNKVAFMDLDEYEEIIYGD